MANFYTGLSALRSSQFALQVVSNNIANANTAGYHRQSVHFQALPPNETTGFRIGSGVSIKQIERIRDSVTESSITNAISDVNRLEQMVTFERRIERAFLSGTGSIGEEIDILFAEMTRLTASPAEPAQREAVLESASRMAANFREAAQQLVELRNAVRFQLEEEVAQLNAKMGVLSEISSRIVQLQSQGIEPNNELDQRDAILNEIAVLAGVSPRDHFSTDLNLTIGNLSIQQTGTTTTFDVISDGDGRLGVHLNDLDRRVELGNGRIAALLEIYNETIPKYEGRLERLVGEMMQKLDATHATGLGSFGSFENLEGSRAVLDSGVALSDSGTVFPVEAGELTISLTAADGSRRTHVLTIDPETESLEDIATNLTALDGLFASVNPSTRKLQISADPGIKFDFTGTVESHPDRSTLTGTSIPSMNGQYIGDTNETLRFEFDGSGQIGITEDLFLNVYHENGSLLQQVPIGLGYEAGSDLELNNGLKLALSNGTVTSGEAFDVRVTANADETGVLAALGLNAFFSGTSASNIDLDDQLQEDASRFAGGLTGDVASTENLFRFLDLESDRSLPGQLTYSQFVSEINTEIGFRISADTSELGAVQNIQARLEQERDAISGVDLNEEMVYLQEFQRSYEAAVRVIQATDQILTELFAIMR